MAKTSIKYSRRFNFVLVRFIIPALIVLFGYSVYHFIVAPRQLKLDTPTLSYPRQSVFYRYSLQSNGLTTTFGNETVSTSRAIAEVIDDMKDIKAAGFDGIRLGYSFRSNNSFVDQVAHEAARRKLYPIGILQGGQNSSQDRAFTPEEMASWQEYVRYEVGANKNIVYYWEIWGEPSLFKYGSPEEFVQLLKVTYPTIKQANPNAKIVVTLGADGRDTVFEDQVLSLGGGEYFDVLSFHPYGANPYLQEDMVKNAIIHEQAVLSKYRNKWPLVISEIGQPASEVSETEQARLAQFLYSEAAKYNIPVTWFYWSDTHLQKDEKTGDGSNWGLIRFDGTERPMLEAVKPYLK